jgi:hypothetical protein
MLYAKLLRSGTLLDPKGRFIPQAQYIAQSITPGIILISFDSGDDRSFVGSKSNSLSTIRIGPSYRMAVDIYLENEQLLRTLLLATWIR